MTSDRYIYIAVMISSFMGAFCGSGLNVALPLMGNEFSCGAGELSRIVSGYIFGSAICMLPMGRVADIIGRRKIYSVGSALFILTNVFAGLVNSAEMLTLLRFTQGCIMSMILGTGMAILVAAHKPSERGKIIGGSVAAVYVGLSLGPVLSGFICEFIGWRFIFFLTAVLSLVSWYCITCVKEEWYGDRNAKFDYKGTFFYVLAVPLLLGGMSELTSEYGIWLMLAGLVLMLIFVWIQLHSSSPLLDFNLFRNNKVFTFSNIASMIHYSATFATSFLMSLYLQLCGGLSPSQAGMFILLQPVMMAALSPKAGDLSDHIPPGKVASVGMAINGVCLLLMSFMGDNSPLWQVGLLLIWIGIGFALFSSPNNNAIMGAVEPKFYGTASSMLATMRTFGQAMSMAIVTIAMSYFAVDSVGIDNHENFLQAMSHCYLLFTVLCGLGVAASLARNK